MRADVLTLSLNVSNGLRADGSVALPRMMETGRVLPIAALHAT
ncbi:hypothetical protein PQR71_31115 [Paraburkholderia fungorum]|jgi:hypothetical protein